VVLRRDPFAMFPFCGYHMGDYFAHWLEMGRRLGDQAPRIFFVNWFRKGADGKYLWPGYGENARVLKWMVSRLDGEDTAVRTDIGLLPRPGALDVSGLGLAPGALDALLAVDRDGWRREAYAIADHFAKFEPRLPAALAMQLGDLRRRFGVASERFQANKK
jgi:phosphoenolpyruvate carboxykinase (GTP)